MNKLRWLELIGRTSADPEVRSLLQQAGVTDVPPVDPDDWEVTVDVTNCLLAFSRESLFPERTDLDDGDTVLTGLSLPLRGMNWGEYTGPLPYDIERGSSRAELRSLLGEPIKSDDELFWDEWLVDELLVRVAYTEDFRDLEALTVHMSGLDDDDGD